MPRVIARLDVRGERVIKGIRFEGRRHVGDPHDLAVKYYEQGADELFYLDAMASLCEHNSLAGLIERATDDVFVPMTVGGGIRTVSDVREALLSGADRVYVNTAAVRDFDCVPEIARVYGSSTLAVGIDCSMGKVLIDYGREVTELDALEWARKVGEWAGEIVLTSIDRDGTEQGFDCDLIASVCEAVRCPVAVAGGAGAPEHCLDAIRAGADAVIVGSILHYGKTTIDEIKAAIEQGGIRCRR